MRTSKNGESIASWRPFQRNRFQIRFNFDGSFASKVSLNDQQIFDCTGVWSKKDNAIYWTYLYSAPELPQSSREDMDKILSAKEDQVVLKSSLTGKQRVMKRASH
ncbi:hypothetical protein [Azomonas macrocytogenes]|uniref:Uncharacterized protein n=1 Tax=Azomonas macrocytogenes TaxID=69962 RepID=A0A839T7J7_AZOMA|nr:hypothetical protein [Azomonas macrocytogenes]MBB3105467.1 hypothetical protein [Azomonas macrocytogenes]